MLSMMRNLRNRFLVQNKIKPLERFTKDIQWESNFNSPEAYFDYYFVDRDIGIVGELSGGMSPLQDTFYLFQINVPKQLKHDHYDLSMLTNIAELYDVPITPMPGIESGWLESLRKNSQEQFELKAQISVDDLVAEMLRWSKSTLTGAGGQIITEN